MNYFYQIDLEKEKNSFLNSNPSNLIWDFRLGEILLLKKLIVYSCKDTN